MPDNPSSINTEDNALSDNLFDLLDEAKPATQHKFAKSKSNVILTGTCAGVANYLNVEPANVRLITILSILLGGWSVIVYVVVSMLLPTNKDEQLPDQPEIINISKENFRTVFSGVLIFVGLYFAFSFIGLNDGNHLFMLPNSLMFPLLMLVIGLFLIFNKYDESILYQISNEKYFISKEDKMLFGVCGGLAKYLKIDSNSLRVVFFLALLLTLGVFALFYFALLKLSSKE